MTQDKYFSMASWVEFPENPVSVLARKDFSARNVKKARLFVIGLGFFEGYINGKLISEDRFLPLNTDFHERKLMRKSGPFTEETAHRIYVCEFDVTSLIKDGLNSLCFMLGNGWYACTHQEMFGTKKLIFRLVLTDAQNKVTELVSDSSVLYNKGFITEYDLTEGECQDFRDYSDNWLYPENSVDGWKNASECVFPETRYMTSLCPPDRILQEIIPEVIKDGGEYKVYDIGKNISGNIVILLPAEYGREIEIVCSEERLPDGDIDPDNVRGQWARFIAGSSEREASLKFTWHAARYFRVPSDIKVLRFDVINTDMKVNSQFNSSYPVLNWIYDAFVTTQLSNTHSGIPSDCPHLERRGYTGDGELTCDAVMSVFDSKEFYRKWIEDISDCQDRNTGHVQYTAPYTHSGGGPGGWGGAIVHVPFMYYKHFGDSSFMKKLYPQMLYYFSFLDEHSENNLVVSDVPDEWCLGDWCTPTKIKIPEPFVNTYFYIKCIDEILLCKDAIELSEADVKKLNKKRRVLVKAIKDKYYNSKTGDFAKNIQGANAFAVDIGIGTKKTFKNMLKVYDEKHLYYNTGIFGTDILTRVLFRNNEGALSLKLLSSEGKYSFGKIMNQGATTLWEYWTGRRSHSHPMFGAVTAYLFEYILGISQPSDSFGYERLTISPKELDCVGAFSGKMTIPDGEVYVKAQYSENTAEFIITLPKPAVFTYKDRVIELKEGENRVFVEK